MDLEDLRKSVQDALRLSEVRAVAQVMRTGRRPALGESIDYYIEPPEGVLRRNSWTAHRSRRTSYRLNVEEWHLAEADRMIGKQ